MHDFFVKIFVAENQTHFIDWKELAGRESSAGIIIQIKPGNEFNDVSRRIIELNWLGMPVDKISNVVFIIFHPEQLDLIA